ncbi:MAG: protein kinase [Archangium sp.]|nr:protein kinase [Archangium sp.]
MKKPTLFGKYLLLERLNVGGMAEVFAAKAFGVEGFERILAIKKILPTMAEDSEFITMFIDEARISVQLSHANVVHIHEFGKHEDAYYIAMEYVSGKDLRALLERFRRRREIMPSAMAMYCAAKLCEGLDYAHRKKDARGQELHIIHRDVSPQNVLIGYEGEVKIIDFGIAKAANRSQKTQAGILKGKFGYMSPEQVRGLPIDRRSDIFAVGVILYEMLTGEKLFVGESDFSTLEKVRNAEVPALRQFNPTVPPALEKVVHKALAREVSDRYQWASDLNEDLMRVLMTGETLYGAKHLSTFMKDAFADDMAREAVKMERYASIEKPETAPESPVPPKRKPAPPAKSKPLASNAPATLIPPPTEEELAEMDQSADRTIMVAGDLKTSIGAVPSAPRPRAKTPPSTASPEETLPPASAKRPQGDTDPTIQPPARPSSSVISLVDSDTSGHSLRPLEASGLSNVESDIEDAPSTSDNETIQPRRPPPRAPKIIIGDDEASLGNRTMIGPALSLGVAPPTRAAQVGDERSGSVNVSTGEASELSLQDTGPRSLVSEVIEADADAGDEDDVDADSDAPPPNRLRVVAMVSAVLVIGVVATAAAIKVLRSAPASIVVMAKPDDVPFSVVIGGQTYTTTTQAIAVEPGDYDIEVQPQDAAYPPVHVTVSVKAGESNKIVQVALTKGAAEPPALPPPPDPLPDTPAPPPKAPSDPKAAPVAPPSVPPTPARYSVVISSPEPGIEIVFRERVVGRTPEVRLVDLPMDKPAFALARKTGFQTMRIDLSNPDRVELLQLPIELAPEAPPKGREPKPAPVPPPPQEEPPEPTEAPPAVKKTQPPPRAEEPPPSPPVSAPRVERGSGKVAFGSNPAGAEIWVDGKNTGKKTPVPKPQALVFPAGKHKVVFKLDGKSSAPKEFDLAASDDPIVVKGDLN